MSEQDNTIRALQIQCATNAKTMDRLRAEKKKLRKELDDAKESVKCGQRYIDRLSAEGETLERVVEMFARALGGKAK